MNSTVAYMLLRREYNKRARCCWVKLSTPTFNSSSPSTSLHISNIFLQIIISNLQGKEGETSLTKCFPTLAHTYFSAHLFILAVGDFVSEDEVIAEIETDKVMGVKIPWTSPIVGLRPPPHVAIQLK